MRLVVVKQTPPATQEEGEEKLLGFGDLPRWPKVPQFAFWSGRLMFHAELELYQGNWEAGWRKSGS